MGGKVIRVNPSVPPFRLLRTCASSPSAAPVWVSGERFVGAVLFIFQVSALDLFWDGGNSERRRWGRRDLLNRETGPSAVAAGAPRDPIRFAPCVPIDTCAMDWTGADWERRVVHTATLCHWFKIVSWLWRDESFSLTG